MDANRHQPDNESPHWYAVAVKHQHERRTETAFQSKKFETLLPLYKSRSRWSDRVREVDVPLFSGYVFCHFQYRERVTVLATPGVRNIVGFGGRIAPVAGIEIEAIRAVMRSKLPVHPWPYLEPGDKVRVDRGPLRGLEGTLLREKDGTRLVIGIGLLQRSIATEMDADMVVPVNRAFRQGA
jgi:transcriptional antiterminator NusG